MKYIFNTIQKQKRELQHNHRLKDMIIVPEPTAAEFHDDKNIDV